VSEAIEKTKQALVPAEEGSGFYIHPDDPGEPGYNDKRKRWSVHVSELEILRVLACDRIVLEIGTGTGLSALTMREAAVSVDTVDIDPWVKREVFPRLREARIRCFEDKPGGERHYDMIFIDGCHTREAVAEDTKWALQHLTVGGIVVWHDLHWESVRQGMQDAGVPVWQGDQEIAPGTAFYIGTPAGMALMVWP
jgi:protein-L-isoaspartate O-methyltransferase